MQYAFFISILYSNIHFQLKTPMKMTMRWYGADDPVKIAYIRQVPIVTGIVSALHDLPPGAAWSLERLNTHRESIEAHHLTWDVLESSSITEAIKLGLPERDRDIEVYQQNIRNLAAAGVKVLCYNFMPVFDWTRTNLAKLNDDGSTALSYVHADVEAMDLSQGSGNLPGWSATYTGDQLRALLAQYANVTRDDFFNNLVYFLKAVVPVAQEVGVFMALHPDDPPWSLWGLPRIVTDANALHRILQAVDNPHNGLTFCTGSLGVLAENDLPSMIRQFGSRIHFVHARNVERSGTRDFQETAHPHGDVPMREVMQALADIGYQGAIRPDHGRMIWGEQGRPGYGLYDRALGAMYLWGLWEGVR